MDTLFENYIWYYIVSKFKSQRQVYNNINESNHNNRCNTKHNHNLAPPSHSTQPPAPHLIRTSNDLNASQRVSG